MIVRKLLEVLAAIVVLGWLALLLLFMINAQSTSLAIVAPQGLWLIGAILLGPPVLGFVLWRVASLIKSPE